jgi:hypothetical protein
MTKTLIGKTLTLGFVTLAVAPGVIGMTLAPQTTMAECYRIPSDAGEGWSRNVCTNSDDDSWFNKNGEECFANPKTGSTSCGDFSINVQ